MNATMMPAPKSKEEFKAQFVRRIDNSPGGKEFITYEGLRYLAQQQGFKRLQVEVLQIPSPENGHLAICLAELESTDGVICTDVGDASPENCSRMTQKHLLRMASTRAKARVLRDFTGCEVPAFEELGEGDDAGHYNDAPPSQPPHGNLAPPVSGTATQSVTAVAPSSPEKVGASDGIPVNNAAYVDVCEVCNKPVNAAISRYSQRRFNRVLCMDCQKNPEATASA